MSTTHADNDARPAGGGSETDESTQETASRQAPDIALPIGRMLALGVAVALGVTVLAGAIAWSISANAAVGAAMGGLASFVGASAGLMIVGPIKARPAVSWHGLLFFAQAISLFLAVTLAIGLLHSAAQPAQAAALPTAAVVFITVWIVFAKSYGRSVTDSRSEG